MLHPHKRILDTRKFNVHQDPTFLLLYACSIKLTTVWWMSLQR